MTGNTKTPNAVRRIVFTNPYFLGPLSRMMIARSEVQAANSQIKAIWRNERGPVTMTAGRTGA